MRRLTLLLATCSLCLTAQRVRAVPDDTRTITLTGNRHPLAQGAFDVGAASPRHRMDKMILVLDSSDEQNQALDELIAAQHNPASAGYQKWLTPDEFADQFGVSQNDVDQISAWLTSHGFSVDEVPAGRRTIVFSGTAGMVERAFHTQIRQYQVNGELHYANASDPQIPEALAGVVGGTVTLHDFRRQSMRTTKLAAPDFTNGGSYYLAPADFATIYNLAPLFSGGFDGTGKSIAIAGRTNINMSDVQTFRSYFGLPLNNPQIVVNGTNPGINSDEDEAVLDVEWSGAVAKGATIKFVVSASTYASDGVDLSAQYIVSNNLAPVMSTSYGNCESSMGTTELAFFKNLWQQAAAEGISVMVSAGDSGAAGCDQGSEATAVAGKAVNGLCSTIYTVCVGGTQFADTTSYSACWLSSSNATTKGSAISYIPEMAWNQSGSVSGGSGLWATGGGASAVYTKPSWQSGPGVPADGMRDVPDISLAASSHDGFLIYEKGSLYVIGGTSASSPAFAGIMAIINQKTGSAQGNPNPTLYALAALQAKGTSHPYFHDVTSGSNSVPGAAGYSAGTGYDLTTGLGTVNASNLVNYWGDAVVTVPPVDERGDDRAFNDIASGRERDVDGEYHGVGRIFERGDAGSNRCSGGRDGDAVIFQFFSARIGVERVDHHSGRGGGSGNGANYGGGYGRRTNVGKHGEFDDCTGVHIDHEFRRGFGAAGCKHAGHADQRDRDGIQRGCGVHDRRIANGSDGGVHAVDHFGAWIGRQHGGDCGE